MCQIKHISTFNYYLFQYFSPKIIWYEYFLNLHGPCEAFIYRRRHSLFNAILFMANYSPKNWMVLKISVNNWLCHGDTPYSYLALTFCLMLHILVCVCWGINFFYYDQLDVLWLYIYMSIQSYWTFSSFIAPKALGTTGISVVSILVCHLSSNLLVLIVSFCSMVRSLPGF